MSSKQKIFVLSLSLLCFEVLAEAPKWVNETSDFCPPTKLCAVGEGTGKMGAAANARLELSRIFETRVIGNQTLHTTATENNGSNGPSGEISESIASSLRESSDEILQGVEIAESYEDSDRFYALAVLDRAKAADRLALRLKEIDEKNVVLFEGKKRIGLYRILKNFQLRDELNQRYHVLKGRSYDSPLSFSDVMKVKATHKQKRTVVSVNVTGESKDEIILPFLINLLLNMDFSVSDRGEASFVLNGNLKPVPQHMKVKGFERYKFIFDLVATNAGGKKVGGLKAEVTETGRNLTQAQERAMTTIQKEIEEKIDQLNIN